MDDPTKLVWFVWAPGEDAPQMHKTLESASHYDRGRCFCFAKFVGSLGWLGMCLRRQCRCWQTLGSTQ
jgi:hypothetical protein